MSFSGLVDDINAMLDTAEPPSIGDCCIYKVPSKIRKLKEDAYTPNVVSIGPFHHGHPELQNMERHKLIHFKAFLQRTKACLNDLVCYVDSILSDFKRCYSETLPFSYNELVKLILLDSSFIIQHFWTYSCGGFLYKPWLDDGITLDLLLLENQLPFFVIEKIYSLSLTHVPNTMMFPSFLQLTIKYFDYVNKSKLGFQNGGISIRHFTDLIRIFHLQHPIERRPDRIDIGFNEHSTYPPSATELLEAGVRFKVNTESKCLLDLRFSGGVLEIPKLTVDDGTDILFRNMVALEQCHYPDDSCIIDYVAFLDFLINNGTDVDILVRKEIMENLLADSDSLANLFNGLCINVMHSKVSSQFSALSQDLNDFCRNRCNKWKATLRRDYCKTPWQTAASIAGILLLVLTLLQSVCYVLQVVQQRNAS